MIVMLQYIYAFALFGGLIFVVAKGSVLAVRAAIWLFYTANSYGRRRN